MHSFEWYDLMHLDICIYLHSMLFYLVKTHKVKFTIITISVHSSVMLSIFTLLYNKDSLESFYLEKLKLYNH